MIHRVIAARALRGFADGLVSVILPVHLLALGFSPLQIGAIATGTLLGSAALTLAAGLCGIRRRTLLFAACALMAGTGAGFALLSSFWPLLAVAVIGTLNPSAGDVSVFLPTEQALLAGATPAESHASTFARYNLAGGLAGALGALASGLPGRLGDVRLGFALYAAAGLAAAALYSGLAEPPVPARAAPLATSRPVVLRLAALFSLDSFGGGFVVQSLLALWLLQRFSLPLEVAGAFFFGTGILGAFSQLVSARLAARIGLVETMVYTHLPANVALVLAAFAPTLEVAIALLLVRAALSQMDVPARQALVMASVPPEERAAAAGVTNVPRSLAAALPPLLSGALLGASASGWPLVCAGVLKATYDVLLLARFRKRR